MPPVWETSGMARGTLRESKDARPGMVAQGLTGKLAIFHAYDVRARFPEELEWEDVVALGRAVGVSVARRAPVLVGRDPRVASKVFARALRRGLRESGRTVGDLGIVPTPLVAYAARRWRTVGLSVTPSHNALGYVGLKGFDPGGRIFAQRWKQVATRFARELERSEVTSQPARRHVGPTAHEVARVYLASIARGRPVRRTVVLDPRGGATAHLAIRAFRAIGASVVGIDTTYSATFFGRSPEPRPSELAVLGRHVRESDALLGVTWDGDGDRVLVVSSDGRWVEPEVAAALLRDQSKGGTGPIVASVDASRKLERLGPVRWTPVGTRHVMEAMRAVRAAVGVEGSSHVYLGRGTDSSDGIRVAIELARSLDSDADRLRRVRALLGPIAKDVRTVRFQDFARAAGGYDQLRRSAGRGAHEGPDGFVRSTVLGSVLVRRSNTEPLVRLTLEADRPGGMPALDRATRAWVRKARTGGTLVARR